MSESAVLSIRVNNKLKNKFNTFCERTGISMSTAMNMYMANVVQNQALPFRVTTKPRVAEYDPSDPFWSPENQAHLQDSIAELESGKWTNASTPKIAQRKGHYGDH